MELHRKVEEDDADTDQNVSNKPTNEKEETIRDRQ